MFISVSSGIRCWYLSMSTVLDCTYQCICNPESDGSSQVKYKRKKRERNKDFYMLKHSLDSVQLLNYSQLSDLNNTSPDNSLNYPSSTPPPHLFCIVSSSFPTDK